VQPNVAQSRLRIVVAKRGGVQMVFVQQAMEGAALHSRLSCSQGNIPSGQHEIQWNANHLASGTYIYRMQAGEFSESRKMILQK